MKGESMRKTHVPNSPTTGRQYHNRQIAHHFCARRSARQSVGLGIGSNTGRSVGRRNMTHFFPVKQKKKHELDLWEHKT
jgi:hypothetical protein